MTVAALSTSHGDRTVVRLTDRESGLSARTIARRPSLVSGLYACLVAHGDTPVQVNPGATRPVDPAAARLQAVAGPCR